MNNHIFDVILAYTDGTEEMFFNFSLDDCFDLVEENADRPDFLYATIEPSPRD